MLNNDLFFSQPLHPQQVKRLAQSLQINFRSEENGLHRQYKSGDGLDFYGTRPFEQGDDVRWIHWALSARTGEWMSKQMHQDRSLTTDIFIDSNSSMHFAVAEELSSFQIALRLLHAWILLTDYSKDPLGFSLFMDAKQNSQELVKIPIFSASRWKEIQYTELHKLYDLAQEQTCNIFDNIFYSRLLNRAQNMAQMQMPSHQRRTSMIVFSDFLSLDFYKLKELSKIKSPARTLFVQIIPDMFSEKIESLSKGLYLSDRPGNKVEGGREFYGFTKTKQVGSMMENMHTYNEELKKIITGELNSHYLALPWKGEGEMMQTMFSILSRQKMVMRGAK